MVEGSTLYEDDPERHTDPLWYDRAEPDEPPGLALEIVALLALLVMTMCRAVTWLYWLPEGLWSQVTGWVERRRSLRTKHR